MQKFLDYILERKSITFDSAKANYGQCIILAGGAGSGKSFIQNKILCDYSVVDVDKFKETYLKMVEKGIIKDDTKYDLANPEDVSKLHSKVKQHGWKNAQRQGFWSARKIIDDVKAGKSTNLPNIIWDMVCGEVSDIENVVKMAKPMGYTVTIIWVVCNKDTAKIANQIRDRHVSDNIIEQTHNGAYEVMDGLYSGKYPELEAMIDKMWLGFSAGFGRKLVNQYEESPVYKIKSSKSPKLLYDKPLVDKFLSEPCPLDYKFLDKALNSDNPKKVKQAEKFIDLVGVTKEEIAEKTKEANESFDEVMEKYKLLLS